MSAPFSAASLIQAARQNPKILANLKQQVQADKGRRKLINFVRMAWPWIEPRELRENWHIELICEHLEAVTRGEIKRLLINMPPRMMKSRLASVIWPVWTWIQNDMTGEDGYLLPTCGAGTKFVCFSYGQDLANKHALDCRRIIESSGFQEIYGDRVQLRDDSGAVEKFENTAGGHRFARPVFGGATGFGGDVLNVDDPQRVSTKADAAELENTLHWFAEVLPTRLNNRKRGAIVVTMQRVHERDVSGYALEKDLGYTHLCLPMRYETNHPFVSEFDLREDDGELLWEDRLGETEVQDLEKTLGSYASAGQLQQRPAPREGGMFKRHWLPNVPAMPAQVADRVRAWDLAGTAKTLLTGADTITKK